MRIVHLLVISSLIITSSCRSARMAAAVSPQNEPITMIGITPQPAVGIAATNKIDNSLQPNASNDLLANNEKSFAPTSTLRQNDFSSSNSQSEKIEISESNQSKNIQSFAQVKAMAADGSLKLNNKQLKRLDKLENKYHGNFNHFKRDISDYSQTAKIIAVVGILGLLLLLLTGSAFGAFVFIIAIGAFLCKWLGLIQF